MNTIHKIAGAIVCSLILPVTAFAASPAPVNLGTAGNFVILTKTGISTTGTTSIVGDLGVSPAAASYITGFALTLPAAGASATSALVTGNIYASDYANPTGANLTTAVLDMQTAYTDAAGRASTVTELGAGNIGGLTLSAGVYTWGTGVTIPTDVTLSGTANDVWIFQIAQNLNVSSGVHIILAGGAQASHIFWQVAGQTTIGTTAVMNGILLDQTAIVLNTGAQLNGRALAQTAVTLDSNAVTLPSAAATSQIVVTPTPTPVATPVSTPASTPSPITTTTTTSTQNPAPTVSGRAIQLGNGQTVYVSPNGSFMNAAGQPIAPAAVSTSTALPSSLSGASVRTIANDLFEGEKNTDVALLQRFLMTEKKGSAALTLSAAGATSYFGPVTRAALAEFQASVGISPALGNFGSITRAYLSTH